MLPQFHKSFSFRVAQLQTAFKSGDVTDPVFRFTLMLLYVLQRCGHIRIANIGTLYEMNQLLYAYKNMRLSGTKTLVLDAIPSIVQRVEDGSFGQICGLVSARYVTHYEVPDNTINIKCVCKNSTVLLHRSTVQLIVDTYVRLSGRVAEQVDAGCIATVSQALNYWEHTYEENTSIAVN